MGSSMQLFDYLPVVSFADYKTPLGTRKRDTCARCGRKLEVTRNWVVKKYCSELCRKRAERARWKAKWKSRGVNKYVGGRDKT